MIRNSRFLLYDLVLTLSLCLSLSFSNIFRRQKHLLQYLFLQTMQGKIQKYINDIKKNRNKHVYTKKLGLDRYLSLLDCFLRYEMQQNSPPKLPKTSMRNLYEILFYKLQVVVKNCLTVNCQHHQLIASSEFNCFTYKQLSSTQH